MAEEFRTETIAVEGSQLIDKVKQLIHEGNVRHITIKQDERIIVEFPLTIGVVGVVLAPVLAAVGALAALLTDCTIEIERVEDVPAQIEQPLMGDPALTTNGKATEATPTAELLTP
jgi:hypothetical protein